MPAPGNAWGERMQHGYAPEGGKRITAHHYRVAKGVKGIIILLPILGECWLRTIPKALPWADLFLSFLSPLCFESEQARAQAVFPPTVYTPLPWGKATGRRASLGNGGGGDVKPTPALPKGGGIMSFCPSVRYKRGRLLSPLPWGKATGSCSCKRTKFERASFARVIDEVASLVEEWGWGWVLCPSV